MKKLGGLQNKRVKRSIEERSEELYRFAEFGRLSMGILHDLVNPLTAVKLNLFELERSAASLAKSRACLERALRASLLMESFIVNVQKHIRIGESEQKFSLKQEIRGMIDLLNIKASKEQVEIKFRCHKDISIWGSPLKWSRLVSNLIGNAVDSYRNINTEKTKTVKVELYRYGPKIILEVKDHGSGIPTEIQRKIFDPFFSTKPTDEGMGIGLSTSKEIVEKYLAGEIKVISKENEGSSFSVSFPIKAKNIKT